MMPERIGFLARITAEIAFVPFLACVSVIVFHSILFAAEDGDAIRKSIRMTAHDEFGGRCPFRACPSLLTKPTGGATMAVELSSGPSHMIEKFQFAFDEKQSAWLPYSHFETTNRDSVPATRSRNPQRPNNHEVQHDPEQRMHGEH